jgi:hypothetical protein
MFIWGHNKEIQTWQEESRITNISWNVRGADTEKKQLTPQSSRLAAIAAGFSVISKDDYDNMEKQFPVYDALYAFAKQITKKSF